MTDRDPHSVLQQVLTWAKQRCPCDNDEPKTCPLCQADVTKDVCLSAENTIPRDLLLNIRITLAAPPIVSRGSTDVLAERHRQAAVEGWSFEHDDQHKDGELLEAALCYAENAGNPEIPPTRWPWALDWWKPKDQRADLVKAGALILAEIERLDRVPSPEASEDVQA